MAHDVFISYSSEDKLAADAVCSALEAARICCWIAPRDVVPALSYSGQITRAIKTSRVMVLIFSKHSNDSAAVLSEVELAANARIPILNFRVDATPLGDDLRFYLQRLHWLDALTPPMEQHHARLVQMIQTLLALPSTSGELKLPPPPPPPKDRRPGNYRLLRILLIVALVAVGVVAILYWIFGDHDRRQRRRTPTPTPTAANSSPTATPELSTDIDKPTPLTSNEIRGKGVGEDIYYYCTFNAGPGEVRVTLGGKNKGGLLARAIGDLPDLGVEILDMDKKRLFYVDMTLSKLGEQKVERFQLRRRQQVIMRILLGKHTLDYMVRLEGGSIDFSPAPKLQSPR